MPSQKPPEPTCCATQPKAYSSSSECNPLMLNSTMQPDANKEERAYNILVHGIERKGLTSPKRPLTDRNYTLTFEGFQTTNRYNDFDGLIVFQGTFEQYEWRQGYQDCFLVHKFDSDQLDRRKKELSLLIRAGVFVCFVLCEPFMDMYNRIRYESTDLCKVYHNFPSFYKRNYESRVTHLSIKMNEFARFLDIYQLSF
jgi:hypothetical protein